MNNATINIRTDAKIKSEAQEIAENLGLSLSAIINAYLKQLVRTKRVSFKLTEKPTGHLIDVLKKSKEDIRQGRLSPPFTKAGAAIKWLKTANKKYVNQL